MAYVFMCTPQLTSGAVRVTQVCVVSKSKLPAVVALALLSDIQYQLFPGQLYTNQCAFVLAAILLAAAVISRADHSFIVSQYVHTAQRAA
jgi:hypothetical protein